MTTVEKPIEDGPIHHVVLFRLKDSVHDGQTLTKMLQTVRRNVPGIVELHFGKDVTDMYTGKLDRSGSYTHSLVSRHTSREALLAYIRHPDHVVLAKHLSSHKLGDTPLIAIDYFTPRSKI